MNFSLYRAIALSFFCCHFLHSMDAPLVAWKARLRQTPSYLQPQKGYDQQAAAEHKASWTAQLKEMQEGRFLKCSDYVTGWEIAARAEAERARWAAINIEAPEFRIINQETDMITGLPYYNPELYYAFDPHVIKLEPNIGWITVLVPHGNPDPALIPARFCIIVGLCVTSEHQRKGYGRRILRKALNFIQEKGYEKAVIRVDDPENHQAALQLYLSEGFVRDLSQAGYVLVTWPVDESENEWLAKLEGIGV